MPEFKVGDRVQYARSRKWVIVDLTGSLAMIEDPWDTRVVPVTSLKEIKS